MRKRGVTQCGVTTETPPLRACCCSQGCQEKRPAAERASASLTHTQPEAVEGMSVDAVQLADQSDGELHHDADLRLLPLFVLRVQKQAPLSANESGDRGEATLYGYLIFHSIPYFFSTFRCFKCLYIFYITQRSKGCWATTFCCSRNRCCLSSFDDTDESPSHRVDIGGAELHVAAQ